MIRWLGLEDVLAGLEHLRVSACVKELAMGVAVESVEGFYPFVLTEDQEALRKEIRQFAAREIAPHVIGVG